MRLNLARVKAFINLIENEKSKIKKFDYYQTMIDSIGRIRLDQNDWRKVSVCVLCSKRNTFATI